MGREGPKATPPLAAFRAGTEDGTSITFQSMAQGLLPGVWLSGLSQEHGTLQHEPCPSEELLCKDWIWNRHLTGTQLGSGKTTYHLQHKLLCPVFLGPRGCGDSAVPSELSDKGHGAHRKGGMSGWRQWAA